jgi:hypothetical protein
MLCVMYGNAGNDSKRLRITLETIEDLLFAGTFV